MKKILLSMTTLSLVMAFSQEKTGINTTNPQATLEVAKETTNATNDVEGILIPRVSKNKAFLMGGNASIEESTLIYVTDVLDYTTTPVDAKVADITENGYYLWNGTKWVTVSSKNGQEWKDGVNSSGNNLIYAKQAKSTGNDIVVTDGGNVGIGTTKPLSPMHIVTEYKGTALGFKNDLIYAYYDGNVASLTDPMTIYHRAAGGSLAAPENLRKNAYLYELIPQGFISGGFKELGGIQYIYKGDGTTALSDLKMSVSGRTSPDIYIKGNHNVGIGTTTPTEELEVNGDVSIGNYKYGRSSMPINLGYGSRLFLNGQQENSDVLYMARYNVDSDQTELRVNIGDNNSGDDKFVIGTAGDNANNKNSTNFDPLFTVINNGRVGVGTTSPSTKLHVNGIGRFDATLFQLVGEDHNYIEFYPKGISSGRKAYIGYPTANSTDLSIRNEFSGAKINLMTLSGNNITLLDVNGNVGIGTTSPGYKLDINGNMKVLTSGAYYLSGKVGSQGINGSGQTTRSYHPFLRQKTSSGHVANIGGLGDWFGFIGYDKDRTNNGYDYSLVMNYESGNVGIGTTSPTQKLHVMGNILASGTITPDYVFEKYYEGESTLKANYRMMNLSEIEAYTKEHKHLPGVPSATEVKENGGVLVNRATEINLEKIEELYLHTIEQEKKIKQQQKQIDILKAKADKVDRLEKLVKELLNK